MSTIFGSFRSYWFGKFRQLPARTGFVYFEIDWAKEAEKILQVTSSESDIH